MHDFHDGPFYVSKFKAKAISSKPKASLAALQWAAELEGVSYGRFTLNLSPADQSRIQAEYEAYIGQRKNELAGRPRVNIGDVDKEILVVEIDDGDIDDREKADRDEALYEVLMANTSLLNEGLEQLVHRLRPIIISASRGYLRVLSWDYSDAIQEARILLWELISRQRYRGGVPFHNFFAKCYSNRLNKLYRDCLLRNPASVGTVQMGWEAHEPVIVGVVGFNEEYIERYRAAQAERNRKLYDKRLAEQGKKRQPILTAEERAVRAAAAKQRATERALAWQRENRDAYNRRRAEIRREKAAGVFVDRRKKCATVL